MISMPAEIVDQLREQENEPIIYLSPEDYKVYVKFDRHLIHYWNGRPVREAES